MPVVDSKLRGYLNELWKRSFGVSMDLGLKGRVAVVTAASRGIGRAIALGFATEGSHVAICARQQYQLEKTRSELALSGGEVLARSVDLTVPTGPAAFLRTVKEQFGHVDILVVNCEGPPAGSFDTLDDTSLTRVFEAILLSTVRLVKEALPGMRTQRWGRIILLQSVTVREPIEHLTLSNVIRPTVAALGKDLSRHLARDRITVNTILPGYVLTDRLKAVAAEASAANCSYEEALAVKAAGIPMGRLAAPDEVAGLTVFLASASAAYITGQAIAIDGGLLHGV